MLTEFAGHLGVNQFTKKYSTLIELLRWRALEQPGQQLYIYLSDGEMEGARLTIAGLDQQARAIAAVLQRYGAEGQRALLLYPAGIEFIPGFFGCLYAGVIAVPLSPPNIAQPERTLPRLCTIARDARPTLVLTTSALLSRLEGSLTQVPELQAMCWLATDHVAGSAASDWREPEVTGNTLALLQYTSGSTASPRGVMVSHANLLENSAHINEAFEITSDTMSVTWLPVFHDMGLTNGIVQPLYGGRGCILMPPQSFLQRPGRWLEAISRYRATISGGPNFAYDMCARRITPEQRGALDLSSWKVAYNGAEPVRADTLKRFAATFAACGFRQSFFYPCYGLAEATLIVSGGVVNDEPVQCTTAAAPLEYNGIVETCDRQSRIRTLIGCGHAMAQTRIVIAHTDSLTACAADEVGEIWVSGPSVTAGYWNRPEETESTFHAYLADTGEGPFLRTGDLGFLRAGELFVTGRLKDLIIIGGRNLYPQDIELTVEQSHAAVRPGGCVAFSVESVDEERLIVAAEVERSYRMVERCPERGAANCHLPGRPPLETEAVVRAIRRAVAEEHDVRVHEVMLLRAGSIPKTPSGKVQRRACEARYLAGALDPRLAPTDGGELRGISG